MTHAGGNRWKRRAAALATGLAASCLLFVALAVPVSQAATTGASSPASGAIVSALKGLIGACPQGGPVPIPCPPEGASQALEAADQLVIKPIVEGALLFTILDFVSFALDRAAYEAAIAISTGASGQTPLIFTDDPEHGYKRFGLDVVGGAMDSLNDFTQNAIGLKLDLCDPTALSPELRLSLQLGIKQAYQPVRPKCDFLEIGKNWSSFAGSIGEALDPNTASERLLGEFAKSLRPGQNELSMAASISFSTREEYAQQAQFDLLQQMSNGGFKDQVDFITGQVKTPASVLRARFEKDTIDVPADQRQSYLQAAIANPNFLIGYLTRSFSIFTNTLASELVKKMYEGYFSPAPPSTNPFDATAVAPSGRDQALEAFSGLITAKPTSIASYNALGEFVTCPSGGLAVRNLNNCVMDQPFFQAVSRGSSAAALTVADAIAQGLLHEEWPLIPPTDEAKNQDPFCYSYGYCYGNLVKLRGARVLPVGWEIAAKLNTGSTPATLGEIIAGFDDCDTGGKWCHLIDPNWVLKYPETQCKAYANGEILATKNSSARAGYCADAPSCIAEDADGNCLGGYGYCVREKNTWQFQGQSCPAAFASCLAFTNTQTNQRAGFLVNTVDFDGCNPNNAGCLWYRTNKAPDTKGTPDPADDGYSFLPAGASYDVATEDARPAAHLDRVYFNRQVKQCQASDAGCAELLRADGLTFNLLRNGSFEDDGQAGTSNAPDNVPDGWVLSGSAAYQVSGSAFSGSDRVQVGLGAKHVTQANVLLSKDSFYAVSAYGASPLGGRTTIITVTATSLTGAPVDFPVSVRAFGDGTPSCTRSGNVLTATGSGQPAGEAFIRNGCTFTATADMLVSVRVAGSDDIFVDAVQLERGENPTDFTDGYSAGNLSAFTATLKVAPSYLNCRGTAADPKECAGYAPVCAASDVGCELYAPEDGDPSVPAVASDLDRCPNECVGYAAFKQEATPNGTERAAFPVHFIPGTARSCQAEHVGCDAYTNLDSLAAGGEGVEYYANLRACSTPALAGEDENTYFTWVGSEREGFQLRTWQLLKSDQGAAPCTSTSMDAANQISCEDPAPFVPDPSCDENADTATNLDCGEFYDAAGVIHYRHFSKVVFVDAQCHPYRKAQVSATVAIAEQDCEGSGGFFTEAGECRYFGLPGASASCPAAAAGCRAYTGGAGNNTVTILDESFEGAAGSLAHFAPVGTLSPALAISADAVSAGGHSLRAVDADLGEGISTAAGDQSPLKGKVVAGKTFMVEFFARGSGNVDVSFRTAAGTAIPTAPVVADLTGEWKPFSIGPIDTAGVVGFDDAATLRLLATADNTEFFIDNLRVKMVEDTLALVKNSWATPSTCDIAPNGAPAPQYYLGCEAYKDRAGRSHEFYRFGKLCSEQVVGCQAFYDTRASASPYGHTYNARCVNAANPTALRACQVNGKTVCQVSPGNDFCLFSQPGALTAAGNVALGPEAEVVYNDAPVYLVDDGTDQCSAGAVGCMEAGKPVFSQDKGQVESFTSAYLLNDPDSYDQVLCPHGQLFCQEFASTKDGNFYFKDPIDQTCEYKDEVELDGQKFRGWFRKGTKEPCSWTNVNGNVDPETGRPIFDLGIDGAVIRGGEEFLLPNNGDEQFDGWAGSCGTQYDLCTEFRDPTDTQAGRYPQGTSYYFKNNDALGKRQVASAACDGRVSQKQGCGLFFNASLTSVQYASAPTYVASNHADILFGESQFAKVDPIDCNADGGALGEIRPPGNAPSVNLCANRCRYEVGDETLIVGHPPATRDDAAGQEYFGSCLVDDDCPKLLASDDVMYEGSCVTLGTTPAQKALWARNDTNTILQVQPDRQCAEWLACSSAQPTWDANAGRFRPVCQAVGLCNEFSAGADDSSCSNYIASENALLTDVVYRDRDVTWSGRDYSGYAIPSLFSVELHQQRNIAPDKWCMKDGKVLGYGPDADRDTVPTAPAGSHGFGIRCVDPIDCGVAGASCVVPDEDDVRLVMVAGSCDEEASGLGGQCEVGFCRMSGVACVDDTNNAECNPENNEDVCTFGFCQAISSTSCTTRADEDHDGTDDQCIGADDAPFCDVIAGRCVSMLEEEVANLAHDSNFTKCRTDAICGSGRACVRPSQVRVGSCVNDECLMTITGQRLGVPDDAIDLSCRSYPEVTSPYASSIIGEDDWEPDLESVEWTKTPKPLNATAGFQTANVCNPVYADGAWTGTDECLCRYKKVAYAGGGMTGYYNQGISFVTSASTVGRVAPKYVCVGGDRDGDPCAVSATSGPYWCGANGQCKGHSKIENVFGYEGYCLERDSSIQLFGEQSSTARPCLTWFPVEQLSGSSNLFAKFDDAGFPAVDAYYCAATDVYYELHTSGYEDPENIAVACAEEINDGGPGIVDSTQESASNSCFETVYCPPGFFAVMTPGNSGDNVDGGDNEGRDDDGVSRRYCKNASRNYGEISPDALSEDCPFICVPRDSITSDGDSCTPPGSNGPVGRVAKVTVKAGDNNSDDGTGDSKTATNFHSQLDDIDRNGGIIWTRSHIETINFDAYLVSNDDFSSAVGFYESCVLKGITQDEMESKLRQGDWMSSGTGRIAYAYPGDPNEWDFYRDLKLVAKPYLACSTLAQVSSSNPRIYNQAWSDRTWVSSRVAVQQYEIKESPSVGMNYRTNTPTSPFGQVVDLLDRSDALDSFPIETASCEEVTEFEEEVRLGGGGATRVTYDYNSYNFSPIKTNGSCPSGDFVATPGGAENGEEARAFNRVEYVSAGTKFHEIQGPGVNQSCYDASRDNDGDPQTLGGPSTSLCYQNTSCVNQRCQNGVYNGRTCSDDSDCTQGLNCVGSGQTHYCEVGAPMFLSSGQPAASRLSQIFAKVIAILPWLGDHYPDYTTTPASADTDSSSWNSMDVTTNGDPNFITAGREEPVPPEIISLGDLFGSKFKEGEPGNITANDQPSGTIRGGGRKQITISFFAKADEDQLPIRTILADWGDGGFGTSDDNWGGKVVGSTTGDNFYKNYRGLKEDGVTDICQSNAAIAGTVDKFVDACESGPISFSNDYTCSPALLARLKDPDRNPNTSAARLCDVEDGHLVNSPCTGGEVEGAEDACVFQPRVFVKDNWGWCAGECTSNGAIDGNNPGCYEQECSINFPNTSPQGLLNDPWVYYEGFIIIEPS